MVNTIKFVVRVLFMPLTLMMIGVTALLEFMQTKPDWKCWKKYNEDIIDTLPFKVGRKS